MARPSNLEIFADMLDVLAIAAVDEDELAADARIDLAAHHPAGRGRKEKLGGNPMVEPGLEDALRRGVEAPDDAHGDRGRGVQRGAPPGKTSWRALFRLRPLR